MKGNERKFPFISFHFLFRIGTFQRVTAEKNKKISAPAGDPPWLQMAAGGRPAWGLPARVVEFAVVEFVISAMIVLVSALRKIMSINLEILFASRSPLRGYDSAPEGKVTSG
jgi:hypothetical protein